MKNKLRRIIREEIIAETMSRKDFILMAREIRKASPQHRDVLTRFAIVIGKNHNPNFDEQRFQDAIDKPGNL